MTGHGSPDRRSRGRPGVPVPSASARPGARLGRGHRRRPPRPRRPGHRYVRQLLGARAQGARPARPDDLLLAWTIRGAPHAYRRRDVAAVTVATAPYSEADAASRVFDASKPLRQAGIGTLDALRTSPVRCATSCAGRWRRATCRRRSPVDSTSRSCASAGRATRRHSYEQPFRLAALQAGLELEPGTSPPVLRRIPRRRPAPYKHLGTEADPRFDLIRGYLRFYGPAPVKAIATYLDAPVAEVKAHLPADTVEVTIDGLGGRVKRYALAEDAEALGGAAERASDGRGPAGRLARPLSAAPRPRASWSPTGRSRRTSGASLAVPAPCWSTARWRAPGGPARRAAR